LTKYWPNLNNFKNKSNCYIFNKNKHLSDIKNKNYLFLYNLRNFKNLDKIKFKIKFLNINLSNKKNKNSLKPGIVIDNLMQYHDKLSFFIVKPNINKFSPNPKYRYNQYKNLNNSIKKFNYNCILTRKLRKKLRKKLVRLLKKKTTLTKIKKKQ